MTQQNLVSTKSRFLSHSHVPAPLTWIFWDKYVKYFLGNL